MDARNNIAQDLFYKIRSRFSGLKLGTETGEITINPEDARFFDFDYIEEGVALGHISISLAEPNSMKIYFSHGITESMGKSQKDHWYGFLRELRQFAKRRLLNFDTRDIAKDNLDKRDYAFLSQNSQAKKEISSMTQNTVGEAVMNESNMYGTRTVSYQKLMDTRLIIKHSQAVMDDTQPGARTRNISALFVENQDGERFKYPFIHLAGARAMQRHVSNGGLPYDDIGRSIIGISEEIAQLKSFSNYVVRNDLMNSDNNEIVERSMSALNQLREQIKRLSRQGYYEQYKENFQLQSPIEIPDDVIREYTDKFTIRNFKEDIKSVFPVLYRLMKENSNIGYDDIVAMTNKENTNDEADIDLSEDEDEFAKFEDWVMGLGESSPLQSDEDQIQAIEDLNKMISQAFPAGVDGTNAIQSLKGIIDDPNLYKQIKDAARQNPQEDVRPMIKAWVDENATTIADQLDFGDMEQSAEEPAAEPEVSTETETETGTDDAAAAGDAAVAAATGGEEQVVTQSDDNVTRDKKNNPEDDPPFDADDDVSDKDEFGNTIKHKAQHLARKGMRQAMDVKELAEFITSFYDRESGTFPKGPEGVVVMVGKKFGEQAEQVARKFVERMAPQQSTENNPKLQELSRIRELAGMQSEAGGYTPNQHPQTKDYDTGDEEDEDGMTMADRARRDGRGGDDDEKNEAAFYENDAEIQELRAVLRDAYKRIYDSASQGYDETDHIADDLDELFDRVEELGDADMQKGFEMLRSTIDMSPEEQAEAAQRAMALLDPPEPDVEIDKESVELNDIRRLSGIAQEGDRIRDISPEDDPDDVGSSFYDEDYVFDLASRVFAMNPNLSAKKGGDQVVDAAYEIMVKDLGKKRASYILRHDEDFVGDLLDTYSRAQHHSKSKDSTEEAANTISELENIRRLSGIAQGMGF
jgi:hypothetical protein